jgi:hypothetical protein
MKSKGYTDSNISVAAVGTLFLDEGNNGPTTIGKDNDAVISNLGILKIGANNVTDVKNSFIDGSGHDNSYIWNKSAGVITYVAGISVATLDIPILNDGTMQLNGKLTLTGTLGAEDLSAMVAGVKVYLHLKNAGGEIDLTYDGTKGKADIVFNDPAGQPK